MNPPPLSTLHPPAVPLPPILHSSLRAFRRHPCFPLCIQVQEELELARDAKDSLVRHHMHLKHMANVYAPSSILVRESDHYALDNILVKVITMRKPQNRNPKRE